MKIPTEQQLLAIEQLQRHGHAWNALLDWLRDHRARSLDDCARADDERAIYRLQGEARVLTDMIGTLTQKR